MPTEVVHNFGLPHYTKNMDNRKKILFGISVFQTRQHGLNQEQGMLLGTGHHCSISAMTSTMIPYNTRCYFLFWSIPCCYISESQFCIFWGEISEFLVIFNTHYYWYFFLVMAKNELNYNWTSLFQFSVHVFEGRITTVGI